MTSKNLDAGIGDLIIASGAAFGATSEIAGAGPADFAAQELAIAAPRREIVFIEDNVADIGTLIRGIGNGKEIVILDSTRDGLDQIAQALAGRSGIDALHIISHGAAGTLNLGALTLDANTLGARHDELQVIGHSLREGGDILLYGCNVGADTGAGQGAGFVDQLAIATGADVAASNNRTGAQELGGDWNLEVASGNVETAAVVDAATAALYHGLLGGIQNQTLNFETFSNFISAGDVYAGASSDAVYKVGGNDAYRLVFDAPTSAVAAYADSGNFGGYVNVAGQPTPTETSVTLSFQNNQLFTLTSLQASTISGTVSEHLVFTGVDKNNQTHTTTGFLLANNTVTTVNFTGFTDLKQLTITTTDNGGVFKFFSLDNIVLADVHAPAPAVTAVNSSTTNGTYKTGDTVHVTVTFDQAVTVNTTGGTPYLQLETGATDHNAVYSGGSGSSTLTFDYTVAAGDTSADLDYLATSALKVNSGTIKSGGGVDADTTLVAPSAAGSLGANKNIVIDGVAPSVSITSSQSGLKVGDTSTITFTFTEAPGASFSAADVTVTGGSIGAISGSGLTRTATFTPSAGVNNGSATVSVTNLSYVDAAGNPGAGGSSAAITYDTLAPTLAITSNKSTLIAGETATITFTFSEDPGASFTWNGSTGSIAVSGGTLSAISGSGLTRTATFTPTASVDSGTASISVNAGQYTDSATNAGVAAATPSITFDTLAPAAPSAPDLDATTDSGASGTDNVTNNTTALVFKGTTAAGVTTVKLYDGATEIGSTSSISGNAYTITTSGALSNGAHTITAKAFDAAGNASSASGSLSVTVDNAAPSVSISSDKSSLKIGETATITFTFSEDPGASFTWDGASGDIAVSGGTLSAISGTGTTRTATFTPSASTNAGTASITVTGHYEDAAGNSGSNGATPSLSYDTLAPGAPSAPDLAAGDDTGTSSTDNLTSYSAATFNGTAEDGATVVLYDGATVIGGATASGGTWSIPVTSLGEGNHALTAVAVDAAGNAGVASGVLNVVVDTTAPATGVSSAQLSDDTGESAGDMITTNGTQTVSGTLSANLAAGEQVMVSTDNGASWTAATASVGTNTWSLAGAALAGSDTLLVQVVDAAGNGGPAFQHAYVVDATAPAAPSAPDLDTASDSGSSQTDDITATTLPVFSGTAEIGATIRLYDGATEIGHIVSTDGTWHITSDTALGQGSHSITAQATDTAGNTGDASSALTVTVITEAPSTGIATIDLSNDSGAGGDYLTNAAAQTISGTLSAVLAAGERVQVSLDAGAHWSDAVATAGSDTWSIATTLVEGSHDIKVRVLDAVDNSGPVATQAYTLDSVKPDLTITSNVAALKIGETATITFTFSEDPGSSFTWNGSTGDVTVSGGTLSAISGSGAVRTASFTPSGNTNGGTASISVAAGKFNDAAGNAGTAGVTPSLHFDTQAPAAASTPDLDQGSDSGASASDNLTHDTALVFNGTAEAGATVKLYDSDGTTEIGTGTATGGVWQITTSTLAAGSHSVTAKVIDAAGNVSSASGAATVAIDTTNPTVAITSDVSQLKIGETATITFTFSENPGASFAWDGSAGSITVSGGTLSAISGTGLVRTATFTPAADTNGGTASISVGTGAYLDAAGNGGTAGGTPSLHFDTLAPSAPSAPDLAADSDSGSSNSDNLTATTRPSFSGTAEAGATVTLYDGATAIGQVTSTDGTWTIQADELGAGSHTITARAVDAAGNASAASSPLTMTVITEGPSTSIASVALSNDTGTGGDFITNADTQTISGTLSSVLAAGERVQVSLDDGAHWNDAVGTAGSDAWSIAATLVEGSHDIKVRVLDAVDNSGPVATQAYTMDSVKPGLTITSDTAALKIGETATISFTFSEDPGASFAWNGSAGDVTVSGGALSAISGSGTVRTATFTPTAGVDGGTASISVAAGKFSDAAGNTGTAGATPSLQFDTLAPAASSAPSLDQGSDSGVSDSDNLTQVTALVFNGTAEAGATVRLFDSDGTTEIGHGTATGGVWRITTSTLDEGSHTVTARVFDAAGNASSASGAATVDIDTTNPTVAITSDVSQLKIGETATITFTFSDDPGTSFAWDGIAGSVTVSGGTLSAISGSGLVRTATFTPAADTDGGTASISVGAGTYFDAAGNDGMAGATPSLQFDTQAPEAPSAPDLTAGSDTGSSNSDNLTADTTPSFSGTAETGATVTLYDGATAIGQATATDGTWTIEADQLGAGSHTITARAVDAAGNEGEMSSGVAVRIITQGPATSVRSMALSNDGGIAGDFITNVAAQTISGSLSSVLAVGERVQVSLDQGAHWNDAVSAAGSSAWSVAATLTLGIHRIMVRVLDAVDNSGPVASQSYTLDRARPGLTITSDVAGLKIGETAAIRFTFSEDPGSSFSWDGSAGDVTVSGGTLSAISGSGTVRTAIFTPTAGVNGGTASISVDAGTYTDTAGNTGRANAAASLRFDTLAPAAASTPDLDQGSDSGVSGSDNLTHDTALVFNGTAEAGATVRLYDNNGSTEIGHGTATGGVWQITTSALAAGSHSVTAKVFDAAGNASSVSGAAAVVIDTGSPTIAISSNLSQLKIGETATITFTFSEDPGASFAWDGSAGSITVGGGTLSAISGSGLVRTAIFTPAAGTNGGTASISVGGGAYLDAAGNGGASGGTPSLHFDTQAPGAPSAPDLTAASDSGISNSDNITANTTPSFSGTAEAGATVTLYDGANAIGQATATDGTWTIQAGSLGAGSHIITARAVDAAGNAGAMSSGLAVRIITEAPTTGIRTIALSNDSGTAGDFITNAETQTITGTLGSVLAAGERVQVSLDQGAHWSDAVGTAGSDAWSFAATLAEGSHDIKVRVVDAVDNSGPVATQAYTLDRVKPSLTISSDTAALKIGETATITFTFSEDPGSSFAWDGSAGDVTVSGGTLSAISGSGTVRTAIFTPAAGIDAGIAGIGVDAGKYGDAAGNAGTAGVAPSLRFDTLAPAALSAPALEKAGDSGVAGDGITNVTTPTFRGTAEALAQVTLYDGARVIGSVRADAAGAWSIEAASLADGLHAISARQVDGAGNQSAAGAAFNLTVDTVAPAAPVAPSLKASTDTGAVGDGITENKLPVIEGTALANSLVTLYDTVGTSTVKIGTAVADAAGKWEIATSGLGYGAHTLAATQQDAAGNVSAPGAAFALRIDVPVVVIDGVPVQVQPVTLPGGLDGSAVTVPIVTPGRPESSGSTGVADIPLVTGSVGTPLLLAQVAPGFGLSASGANAPAAGAAELLIAAITAATPGHAPSDQGHLTGNGQSFLDSLGSNHSLLVETLTLGGGPIGFGAALTLSGPVALGGQSTALVLDATGLSAGATIALQQVDFAAVVGAANVVAKGSMVLTGDAASQHFTVSAGSSGQTFAGGGNDTLSVGPATGTVSALAARAGDGTQGASPTTVLASAPAAGTALLHGGSGSDTATFSGARDDYIIESHNGYLMVSSKLAPDVNSMVVNVEQLQFSDASVAVQNSSDLATLAGLYESALGRQADVKGIEYWAGVHQSGASWGAIVLDFIGSNEHAAGHEGFNGDAGHDFSLLYAALFDRAPDAAGLAYWTAVLESGATLEQIATDIVKSAEMVGHQVAPMNWDFFV